MADYISDYGSPFIRRRKLQPRNTGSGFNTTYSSFAPTPEENPAYQAAISRPRNGAGITQRNVSPNNPVSASRYIGQNGVDLGPQYDRTGGVNPLPRGAVGVQGAQNFNQSLNGVQPQDQSQSFNTQMSHTDMATEIARRNLAATGSLLGGSSQQQQIPSGFQGYVSPEDAAQKNLQWTGGSAGWQPYLSPEQATAQHLQYSGGQSPGSANAASDQTVHFLPPGFSTAIGSTGVKGSSPNDIHFLPPGFTAFQATTGDNGQLQFKPNKNDQGYGSAYGF